MVKGQAVIIMAAKKAGKKSKVSASKRRDEPNARCHGIGPEFKAADRNGNGTAPVPQFGERTISHPVRLNPESAEERRKRLTDRKALTLRAFRITYENRRRKTS
jgi:hypothetical protein